MRVCVCLYMYMYIFSTQNIQIIKIHDIIKVIIFKYFSTNINKTLLNIKRREIKRKKQNNAENEN